MHCHSFLCIARLPRFRKLPILRKQLIKDRDMKNSNEGQCFEESIVEETDDEAEEAEESACNTEEAADNNGGNSITSELVAQEKIAELTRKLKSARREVRQVTDKLNKTKAAISKLFGEDQLKVLATGAIKGSSWTQKTIKVALKSRLACGLTG